MSAIETITITIGVKNAQKAAEWYQSLLGEVEQFDPGIGAIELKVTDSTWLQLDESGDTKAYGNGMTVRFSTDDITTAHQTATRLSREVSPIETVEGVASFFDFKDPDGNRLSYVQILEA